MPWKKQCRKYLFYSLSAKSCDNAISHEKKLCWLRHYSKSAFLNYCFKKERGIFHIETHNEYRKELYFIRSMRKVATFFTCPVYNFNRTRFTQQGKLLFFFACDNYYKQRNFYRKTKRKTVQFSDASNNPTQKSRVYELLWKQRRMSHFYHKILWLKYVNYIPGRQNCQSKSFRVGLHARKENNILLHGKRWADNANSVKLMFKINFRISQTGNNLVQRWHWTVRSQIFSGW